MDFRPIGVFDSGLGGLSVVQALIKRLPYENIVYLGDTASLPYGTKSRDTIIKLAVRNILFLLQKKVKIIVVACNTASSVALERVAGFFSVPVSDIISAIFPSVFMVSKGSKHKKDILLFSLLL